MKTQPSADPDSFLIVKGILHISVVRDVFYFPEQRTKYTEFEICTLRRNGWGYL